MSRLGKLPIHISKDTQVKLENDFIVVKGPKGELKQKLDDLVKIKVANDEIIVSVEDEVSKKHKAMWGLYRSLINNMVKGVTDGFEKKLEVNGVGYKIALSGNKIVLNVGYSHPVDYNLMPGISASVEGNIITIIGVDKQAVGETAAQIRKIRKPEPYKGKGIKYVDEVIIRKVGKTAVKGE